MHIHIGLIDFLVTGSYLLIWLFFLRLAELHFSDSPFGKAVSFFIG